MPSAASVTRSRPAAPTAASQPPRSASAPTTASAADAATRGGERDPQVAKRGQDFEDLLTQTLEMTQKNMVEMNTIKRNLVKLQKMFNKEQGLLDKAMKKKARSKTLSGFAKPGFISAELCEFLNEPAETQMARTDVTKYLTKYIEQHKLQDDDNRRVIKPNAALAKLLDARDEDEITYFNLQSYMKRHYTNPNAVETASAGKKEGKKDGKKDGKKEMKKKTGSATSAASASASASEASAASSSGASANGIKKKRTSSGSGR